MRSFAMEAALPQASKYSSSLRRQHFAQITISFFAGLATSASSEMILACEGNDGPDTAEMYHSR